MRPLLARAALGLFVSQAPWLVSRAAGQVVQYDITDSRRNELPAKLTFLTPLGKVPAKLDVKSRVPEFAARKNVVYQLYGKGEVPLPAGDYRVYVSRGMEWSIAVQDIRVSKERPAVVKATLDRVVDTRGYLSGDLHLHTKTFSGHGDANVEERLITLCAENLEWAVATDHNYLTDYRPYVRRLGADRWLTTSIGNEVTTSVIGHFNTFPLEPRKRPVDHRVVDPRAIFRKMRQNPLDEIIQINHPRWVGVTGAYFRELDLSLGGGDPANPVFCYDFDCLEVLNDNTLAGWELYMLEGEKEGKKLEPVFDHSVREDWFNLLNRGFTYAGVGNSDSHEVDSTIGGCPRNFILSPTDDPARAAEADLVRGVRRKEVTVSSGIFVTMFLEGPLEGSLEGQKPLGSTAPARGGEVRLGIQVQAAPWIDADRLVVIGNGEPVFTAELPPPPTSGGGTVRFRDAVRLRPKVDTWYIAYAVGDQPPYPMLHKVTVPLGFTNPIWIDADGDGRFTPLRELAAAAVAPAPLEMRLRPGEIGERLRGTTPAFRRHAVAALVSGGIPERVVGPLAELLSDPDPGVRQGVAMALSGMDDRRAVLALLSGRSGARSPWERFVFNRELVKAGDLSALEDIRREFEKAEGLQLFQMRRDLKELCRNHRIARWWVVGPFPARGVEKGLAAEYPPDWEIDYSRRYPGFEKKTARWKRHSTDQSHYLNLRDAFDPNQKAAAYAHVTVRARRPVETCLLLGSKCGLEVRLNGRALHRQVSQKTSSAAQVMVPASFRPGPNSLLVKAVVEKDEWGFNLMVIDTGGDLEFIAERSDRPPRQSF